MNKTYLGDGVYASCDGWMIWLSLDGQDESRIALEPAVFQRLVEYEKAINKENDEMSKAEGSGT